MKEKLDKILFPIKKPPNFGEILEISDDIFWARMPLPMILNHVNVYILNSSDGLTIIDTGINTKECIFAWEKILKDNFFKKKINQIIITHHHPDHIGLAGWFAVRYDAKIFSSRTSWLMARMLTLDVQNRPDSQVIKFWKNSGMNKKLLNKKYNERPFNFSDSVFKIPIGFESLSVGQTIQINKDNWKIEIGNGHAPEHLMIYNSEKAIIFSGDQIIANISSNLGVYATEPNLDTVGLWIDSCKKFLKIFDDNFLVLPGHKLPFYGAKLRLNQLITHHENILKNIEDKLLSNEFSAVELFETVFGRDIRENEYVLALGETIGHINYFKKRGLLSWTENEDEVLFYKMSLGK